MYAIPAAASSDIVVSYELSSANDFDVETYLVSQSAPTNYDLILTLPAGQIIGHVSASAALTMGDLSAYQSVTLQIAGSIQAKTGEDAIQSDVAVTLINNGTIYGSLDTGIDAGGTNLTIKVLAGGEICPGGGNGGAGGTGGNGDTVGSWSGFLYSSTTPKSFWSTGYQYVAWRDEFNIGYISSSSWIYMYAYKSSATKTPPGPGWYMWNRGTYHTSGLYEVRYATKYSGTGGIGGAGGTGQGFGTSATAGSAGTAGTYRSGSGGAGGAGGTWGIAGAAGAAGADGLYYSNTSSSAIRSGSSGSVGTSAGLAITF